MRPSRFACAVAIASALLAADRTTSAPGSPDQSQTERPEVRALTLSGVRSVDRAELLQSIATTASRCRSILLQAFCPITHSERVWEKRYLDRTELRRDVLRIRVFYWKRGFREATVDTIVAKRGSDEVAITFKVNEGIPTLTQAIRVTQTDSVFSDGQIRRMVDLEAGKPFNLVALDSTVLHMRTVLQDLGYAEARVDTSTVVDTAAHSATAAITINPRKLTYIGAITIDGNKDVSERTIRNSLSFHTGDLFKRNLLGESQRRLYESGLFQRASITARRSSDSGSTRVDPRMRDSLREVLTDRARDSLRAAFLARPADTLRTIEVTVSEAPQHITRVSGGFNTFDFIQVDGRFTHNNFYGGARLLNISATLGNLFANTLNGSQIGGVIGFQNVTGDIGDASPFLRPTYQGSIDFTQPWLGSPRNSAGLGVFVYRRQAPAVFVERGEGANVSFTREVAARVPVSLAYRFELTGIEAGDLYFCVNYGVCDPQTVTALRARQRISPLALTANFNRQNDPLEPTRGYLAQARFEHASAFTGSTFRYNSVYLEGAAYRPIGRSVLAAHTRVGFVRALSSTKLATGTGVDVSGDILHPRTRLYAGGARSVRGVGENQLGPRVLTLPPSKLKDICPELSGEAIANCDLTRATAEGSQLTDRDFTPRPLGGRALIEGSVEYRFPVWGNLYGAAFVDGALLGQGSLESATKGAGAVTPGIGVRYRSAVGPIRVDLGLNPTLPEDLPVITQVTGPDGQLRILQLNDKWRYNPTKGAAGVTGVLRRLTLHLSIGEAY